MPVSKMRRKGKRQERAKPLPKKRVECLPPSVVDLPSAPEVLVAILDGDIRKIIAMGESEHRNGRSLLDLEIIVLGEGGTPMMTHEFAWHVGFPMGASALDGAL